MRNVIKPQWLLLSVTLPQLFIFAILGRIFYIINSQLSTENINMWLLFGSLLAIMLISFTAYGVRQLIYKKEIHSMTGLILFLSYIPYLYFLFIFSDKITPSSIPTWMTFDLDPSTTVYTLLIPSFVYAVLVCVYWSPKKINLGLNKKTILPLWIPLFWFLLFTVLIPALHQPIDMLYANSTPILFVTFTVLFLFIITKLIILILTKNPNLWKKLLFPIVILGPQIGLWLNIECGNMFGNFSSLLYFILALITSILIVLPSFDNKYLRAALFFTKSITLTFSTYFFIIFLPYLPISFIAILLIGLGILMLAPLLQAFAHVKSLWEDAKYLHMQFNKSFVLVLFIIGISIIPGTITYSFMNDKTDIDKALNYVYQKSPSDKDSLDIDTSSIESLLNNIRQNKNSRNRDFISNASDGTPILTAYYNWLVLDNLTISAQKLATLEDIFLGTKNNIAGSSLYINNNSNNTILTNDVNIQKYSVETKYDSINKCLRSWINLELFNTGFMNNQFFTTFELPDNCYISNYYLYVGDKKKFGLIADKRAANWIYNQIVTVRRDPGILSYVKGNKIEFKVFPFNDKETRKTGFEVIHTGPVDLKIENTIIKLEAPVNQDISQNSAIKKIDNGLTLVSPEAKKQLKRTTRSPEYYFILDKSLSTKGNEQKIIESVETFIKNNSLNQDNIHIFAQNYNQINLSNGNWQNDYLNLKPNGGLYLDNTFKSIYFDNYKNKSDKYPSVIVVANDISKGILINNYEILRDILPDVECFYSLSLDGKLGSHYFNSDNIAEKTPIERVTPPSVLVWEYSSFGKAYLKDDASSSIALAKPDYTPSTMKSELSSIENASMLKALCTSIFFQPEKTTEKTLEIVKASIKSGIMTPYTSYIVLENEAQEKVLLEKQKKILSTKKPLDLGETPPTNMSEPPLLVVMVFVFGFILILKIRKRSRI